MPHARQQHPNAVLTPTGRRRMVACVVEQGWATAERFQVDAKTVRKWCDPFLTEGIDVVDGSAASSAYIQALRYEIQVQCAVERDGALG